MTADLLNVESTALPDLPGSLREPTVEGLPKGYKYGVTRYADVILKHAFASRWSELVAALEEYTIDVDELIKGGGARSSQTKRFDGGLESRGWGTRNVTITKLVDDTPIHRTPGHEIDMFAVGIGGEEDPYPGIAVEMEWNNKDPFFDRDLLNFQALHREGALAVGVVVTRGPELQRIAGPVIKTSAKANNTKYGASSTHWDKLAPRINLGGGGECPLIAIGIEPERITGFDIVREAHEAGEVLY